MSDQDPNMRTPGHGPMMLLMCVPMLVIAFAIVSTGAGWSSVIAAVACMLMMVMMMRMMSGGGRQ